MVCLLIKFCRVSSSIHGLLDMKINVEFRPPTKQYQIYQTCQARGKEEEKTLIPGPVWYVEKFILAQHCFKPAPAAIGNVP